MKENFNEVADKISKLRMQLMLVEAVLRRNPENRKLTKLLNDDFSTNIIKIINKMPKME